MCPIVGSHVQEMSAEGSPAQTSHLSVCSVHWSHLPSHLTRVTMSHNTQRRSASRPGQHLHWFYPSESNPSLTGLSQPELWVCLVGQTESKILCLVFNSISKSNFSLKEVLRGGSTWLWWTFLKRMLMTTLVSVSMQVKHFLFISYPTHKK